MKNLRTACGGRREGGGAVSKAQTVAVVRGRGLALEIVLSEQDVEAGFADLDARLARQPDFYRGSKARAVFGATMPPQERIDDLRRVLDVYGIELESLDGGSDGSAPSARLSTSARSLVADFAGARADIASRRQRGESSVRRSEAPQLRLVEVITTRYHIGTLRGGQTLHHVGNLVVVGDVNPGAEVVATGDILVFGRLAGVAHAGAQGDESAHVYALELRPVQLRIASCIAAEDETKDAHAHPEVAFITDAHITVVPYSAPLEAR